MSSAAIVWEGDVAPPQPWGAERMALVSSEDMARGLFLQSVLKAIRALGDEALVERCTAVCGQKRFADFLNEAAEKLNSLQSWSPLSRTKTKSPQLCATKTVTSVFVVNIS